MNTYIVLSLLFVGLNAFPMTPDSDSVGDVEDVDPNQPEVKEAISFAFNVIHDSIDSTHAITMGKVLKTQSQVVSGEKFYITLEVNETDCAKHVTDLKPCKVIRSEVCTSVVLSRYWDPTDKNQILSFNCNGF